MGRMRRQRRYKACDPFSNKKRDKDDRCDQAPKHKKEKDDLHFKESLKVKTFQKKIEKAQMKRKGGKLRNVPSEPSVKSKAKKVDHTTPSQQLPNESNKKYLQRLDRNVQEAVSASMVDSRTIRKKRKQHLQARDEKRKNKKKAGNGETVKDFRDLKDDVSFGDVALAPPATLATPRNAPTKNKLSNLKLMELIGEDCKTEKKPGSTKKRKDMDDEERYKFDNQRQQAIDSYRLIKKRKEMKNEIT